MAERGRLAWNVSVVTTTVPQGKYRSAILPVYVAVHRTSTERSKDFVTVVGATWSYFAALLPGHAVSDIRMSCGKRTAIPYLELEANLRKPRQVRELLELGGHNGRLA